MPEPELNVSLRIIHDGGLDSSVVIAFLKNQLNANANVQQYTISTMENKTETVVKP